MDEAEAAYKSAVNADQNDPTPWADLGDFYAKRGNIQFALQCATRASKLLNSTPYNDHSGETPEAWVWRSVGCIFVTCKRPADGIPHFKRSISVKPDDAQSWLFLAFAYLQTNDRANAISAAQQALKLDPNSADAKLAVQTLTAPPPQQQTQQPPAGLTVEEMRQWVELAKQVQELRNKQQQEQTGGIQQQMQMLEFLQQLQRMGDRRR